MKKALKKPIKTANNLEALQLLKFWSLEIIFHLGKALVVFVQNICNETEIASFDFELTIILYTFTRCRSKM